MSLHFVRTTNNYNNSDLCKTLRCHGESVAPFGFGIIVCRVRLSILLRLVIRDYRLPIGLLQPLVE